MGVTHAAPNLYQFSDERPRQRELAIKHTLKTFEFATRVQAPVVVLHLGSMELKDYTGRLCEMLERGGKDSIKFIKLRAEADAKREEKKEKFVERVYDTLRKILPEAEKRGLKLGCENRQALEEIPLDSDFQFFFREFTSPNICYWHDCGHAQIKENLGFIHHALHLESLAQDRHPLRPVLHVYRIIAGGGDPADVPVRGDRPTARPRRRGGLRRVPAPPARPLHHRWMFVTPSPVEAIPLMSPPAVTDRSPAAGTPGPAAALPASAVPARCGVSPTCPPGAGRADRAGGDRGECRGYHPAVRRRVRHP